MATRVSGPKNAFKSKGSVAYADDCYGWARDQAALARSGRVDDLDQAHLADGIVPWRKRD